MKIKIAVDASPIISALIGGVSRNILFDYRFDFISTGFTLKEVEKYLSLISEKSGVSEEEIRLALGLMPLRIYQREEYGKQIKSADKIIGKTDKNDVDILALSFHEGCLLWSEDKHFRNKKEIKLVRTKDLI